MQCYMNVSLWKIVFKTLWFCSVFSLKQLVKMAENENGENMSILESKICQQIEVSSVSVFIVWDLD